MEHTFNRFPNMLSSIPAPLKGSGVCGTKAWTGVPIPPTAERAARDEGVRNAPTADGIPFQFVGKPRPRRASAGRLTDSKDTDVSTPGVAGTTFMMDWEVSEVVLAVRGGDDDTENVLWLLESWSSVKVSDGKSLISWSELTDIPNGCGEEGRASARRNSTLTIFRVGDVTYGDKVCRRNR